MLSDLPNIGKTLAERMQAAGIHTADELRALGAQQAFIQVRTVYPEACINHLYALEGAVQGIRWHHLPDETKQVLREFYKSL